MLTSPWKVRLAWSVAALFCFLKVLPEFEVETRFREALMARDHESAGAILERAAWYGRDTASLRTELANLMVQSQLGREALPHYWRALELEPSAQGFAAVGELTERTVGPHQSFYAYDRGLERYPDDPVLNRRKGFVLIRLRRFDEARPLLERVLESTPDDEEVRQALERVRG